MKKQYIRPETELIEVENITLLSGSEEKLDYYTDTKNIIEDESMFLSKEHYDIWNDEEF